MRRFRSHYPPVSFQGIFSKQWYIICSGFGRGKDCKHIKQIKDAKK